MERTYPVVLPFTGGYQTDLSPQSRDFGYLLQAENVIYEVDGTVRKLGGTTAINNGVEGTEAIVGMFDYWRAGVAGAFAQKFVSVTSEGRVVKEDMDGIMDDITGTATISDDVVPVFCQARDLLTIWTSANNTPLKWNQTGNVTPLLGSPPVGRGAVFHVNRLWVWGTVANPSRITYSSSTDIEDWTVSDSGSMDLDPEDGDIIIGAVSYKNSLIVFKGPNKGSIHIISGTGVSTFARNVLVRGIPLQSPNAVVPVGDDLLFMSDRGIHSLGATQQYGNFVQADLTRFLRGHFRIEMTKSLLNKVWAIDYAEKSCVLFCYAGAGSLRNDHVLALSYVRFQEEGWKASVWGRTAISAAIRIEPLTKHREVIFGSDNGFYYKQDTAARILPDGTAYAMRILTPELLLGKQDGAGTPRGDQPFNIERIYLRSVGTGDWNVHVSLVRDRGPAEDYVFNQGAAGFILDTSMLDEDVLGSSHMQISYADLPVGEARTVQFDIFQAGYAEDAHLVELGLEITPTAQSNVAPL